MPNINQSLRWQGLPATAADRASDPAILEEPDLEPLFLYAGYYVTLRNGREPTMQTIRRWMEEEFGA